MFNFAQRIVGDLRDLPRGIRWVGCLLAIGAGAVGVVVVRSNSTSGLVAPAIALATAGLLAWFAIGKLAQVAARHKSRGLGIALWERMSRRRPRVTTKTDLDAERQLQERWRDVHELLEGKGYDFYTLPWYLIFGASQSGKTTLVQKSGLEFPIGDRPVAEYGSTKNCTWFFTNRAILIDTAGRYVDHRLASAPGDAERESAQEWQQFLALLRKHRPRSPLNGIILALKVPDVMAPDAAARERTGAMLRDAMRDIESELRIQCPVYVMVTMCDRVLGFAEFFKSLPGLADRTLLGWSRPGPFTTVADAKEIEHGLDALIGRLRAMRLEFLRETKPSAVEPPDTTACDRLFAFPEEFAVMSARLREILAVAFAPSSYHQPPFLRGVYFTSALQKDDPFSEACAALLGASAPARPTTTVREVPVPTAIGSPLAMRTPVVAGDSKAFFVADFLEEKVFKEVGLVCPTSRADRRRRRLERVTLVAGLVAVIAVACVRVSDVFRASELFARVVEPASAWQSLSERIAHVHAADAYAGANVRSTLFRELVRDFARVFANEIDRRRGELTDGPWDDETYIRQAPWLLDGAHVIVGKEGDDGKAVRDTLLRLLTKFDANAIGQPLATLIEPDWALALWRQELESVKAPVLAAVQDRVHGYWRNVQEKLESHLTEIECERHGMLWGDVVAARLRQRVDHLVTKAGKLIERASRGERSKEWEQLRSDIDSVERAMRSWVDAPADAGKQRHELHRNAAAAVVHGARLPSFDELGGSPEANAVTGTKASARLAGLRQVAEDMTPIVAFDPAHHPLFSTEVWRLTAWEANRFPPGMTLPTVAASADPDAMLDNLRKVIADAEPGLVNMVETRALQHLNTVRRLPLADYSPAQGEVSETCEGLFGGDQGKVARFLPKQAGKATALFARWRRAKIPAETRNTIDEIENEYSRHLEEFWDKELVDLLLRPERRCSDRDAARRILTQPALDVEKLYHYLGVDEPASPQVAREPQIIFQRFNAIADTKELAKKFGDMLDRLHTRLPDTDFDRSAAGIEEPLEGALREAIASHKTLESACSRPTTKDPVRAALTRQATHVKQALSFLAQEVLQRHWVRPEFFKPGARASFPFGGANLECPNLEPAVDFHTATDWFNGSHQRVLAAAIWPAVDKLSDAHGVFDVSLPDAARLCFIRTMRLRQLLTTDRVEIQFRSVDRAAGVTTNSLRGGWFWLQVAGTRVCESGPYPVNTFRFTQAFDCVSSVTTRFEVGARRDAASPQRCASMPLAHQPARQSPWYPLAFLFLQRDGYDCQRGLKCRASFYEPGAIVTENPVPQAVASARRQARQWLWFWAMPVVGGEPLPLALPDELPDLAEAGFFGPD